MRTLEEITDAVLNGEDANYHELRYAIAALKVIAIGLFDGSQSARNFIETAGKRDPKEWLDQDIDGPDLYSLRFKIKKLQGRGEHEL